MFTVANHGLGPSSKSAIASTSRLLPRCQSCVLPSGKGLAARVEGGGRSQVGGTTPSPPRIGRIIPLVPTMTSTESARQVCIPGIDTVKST